MTSKIAVSVPDEVAAWLRTKGNVSAAVTSAVQQVMNDEAEARQRRRAGIAAYAAWVKENPAEAAALDALFEESNRLSLEGHEWGPA
jgi:post-segregation antitoxin (ccd killing protein)